MTKNWESYIVAKTKTFLGLSSQEEEGPKLLLHAIHLFYVVVLRMLLAVVIVIWWCSSCGFVEFSVDPTASTVDLQDHNSAATIETHNQWKYVHFKFTTIMSRFMII